MHFDRDYKEDVTLADGTVARLRLLRPDDKPLLVEGFAHLSPESRYRRFFTMKNELSPAELRYLTEVDGDRHFAIGAMRRDEGEKRHGVGVGRFVRTADGVAEPAVVVIDEMQGKGLGRILFERLVLAARERGVHRFRTEVLATNTPMRALLDSFAPSSHVELDDEGVLHVETPLDDLPIADAPSDERRKHPLYALLALAAQGLVVLRRAIGEALHLGDHS